MPKSLSRGFTLIELMITVAILAILSSVALPTYQAYVQRSRVPPGLDALSNYHTRMEQRFQDTGNYGAAGACGLAVPAATNFAISCALTNGTQGFTATATGSGPVSGYTYTINHQGTRATSSHPKGVPAGSCWSIRGATCDS